ncbi:dihydroorotate dehydrogenase electron transfer subunit [Paraburkholderia dipogonis]|uniref:Dihydroorotate dehydrogenase electron transfer subunit n=1 Tax=Paraburkholderia dipogonis TaxID=1211383 RepID=A0A4Y8MT35_9BURK|nr:dihydroorotate dehydrogenase electron transfer subunit [Paraburkholderia dipogonis]TFE40473.1 dihydroorotate dehydrogenase electron transfer subunit [Paraburkholderia dipogonis]
MTEALLPYCATHDASDAPTAADCGGAARDIAEHACQVLVNQPVNAEYRHMVVRAPAGASLAQPGQFFHLACPPGASGSTFLRRPMSVYGADPVRRTVEFLYKVQGAGTQGLATLQPGDTLDALGPLGSGFSLPDCTQHLLLLARGVGLATLSPLAAHAVARGARVTAVLSARSKALVMSAQRWRAAGATVHIVTDEDGDSDPLQLEAYLRDQHAKQPFDFLSTCGSNRLLVLLQKLGNEWDVAGQTAIEQHMGCGMGSCYACVRPFRESAGSDRLTFRRVCWDGPVFDLQETTSW